MAKNEEEEEKEFIKEFKDLFNKKENKSEFILKNFKGRELLNIKPHKDYIAINCLDSIFGHIHYELYYFDEENNVTNTTTIHDELYIAIHLNGVFLRFVDDFLSECPSLEIDNNLGELCSNKYNEFSLIFSHIDKFNSKLEADINKAFNIFTDLFNQSKNTYTKAYNYHTKLIEAYNKLGYFLI